MRGLRAVGSGAAGVALRVGLDEGWQIRAAAPGALDGPAAVPDTGWLPARAPSTVAAALRAAGAWSLDAPARRFDAEDWWWRTRFARPASTGPEATETVLGFDGLATLADVWLNGTPLLSSENMFVA